MRAVQISEALTYGHDELVPSIHGTIKEIFKPNKMTGGDFGPSSFQNFTLVDAAGKTMKGVFKNREELPVAAWKGHAVFISCKEGEKGLSGVKVKDEEYPKDSGKLTKKLWVTATASVEMTDGEPAGDTTPDPETTAKGRAYFDRAATVGYQPDSEDRNECPDSEADYKPAQSTRPPPKTQAPGSRPTQAPAQSTPPAPDSAPKFDHVAECRKRLNRSANFWLHASAAADYAKEIWETKNGAPMPDALYQALIATILIETRQSGFDAQNLRCGKFEY